MWEEGETFYLKEFYTEGAQLINHLSMSPNNPTLAYKAQHSNKALEIPQTDKSAYPTEKEHLKIW